MINRRSFLIGSAAAFAAASVPLVATADLAMAQTQSRFPCRWIVDISITAAENTLLRYEIFRKTAAAESPLLKVTGYSIRWIAPDNGGLGELIFPSDHILGFRVEPAAAKAHLTVAYFIDGPGGGVEEAVKGRWESKYEYADDDDYEGTIVGREWIPAHKYKRRRIFAETYQWDASTLTRSSFDALDLRDIGVAA